jgi:hypothetical protein
MPNMLPVNMGNSAVIAHDLGGRLALFVHEADCQRCAVQQSNSPTVQQSNSSTVQQFNSSTVQQFYVLCSMFSLMNFTMLSNW